MKELRTCCSIGLLRAASKSSQSPSCSLTFHIDSYAHSRVRRSPRQNVFRDAVPPRLPPARSRPHVSPSSAQFVAHCAFPFLPPVFFFGLPLFSSPGATSQFGCLHFGQRAGLVIMRFTHA